MVHNWWKVCKNTKRLKLSEQFVFLNCTNTSSGIHLTKVICIWFFSLWPARYHNVRADVCSQLKGIPVEPPLYSHSVGRSPFLQIKKFTDLSQWVLIVITFLWMVNTLLSIVQERFVCIAKWMYFACYLCVQLRNLAMITRYAFS